MIKTGYFERMLSTTSQDKEVEVPGIGLTSCNNLRKMFESCTAQYALANQKKFCWFFNKLSYKCYMKSSGEFYAYIRKKQEKDSKLMDYLEENGSVIPSRLRKFGFYNIVNVLNPEATKEDEAFEANQNQPAQNPMADASRISDKISENKSYFKNN